MELSNLCPRPWSPFATPTIQTLQHSPLELHSPHGGPHPLLLSLPTSPNPAAVEALVPDLEINSRRSGIHEWAAHFPGAIFGGGVEPALRRRVWDDQCSGLLDAAAEIIRPDGGPPRWFCPVECGRPIENSPLLLFLPGIDGVGMGLILHHKSLGKAFEVRCLHIPVNDRTPFEGLVKFVEHSMKYEQAMSPNKPIYVVGDSFGGCLALAFAARNPAIDLILVLINPATSFQKSQLQPLLPVVEALPKDLHITVPYLFSFIMGDSIKMAMTSVAGGLPFRQRLDELSKSLTMLLPRLSDLADILPRETLLWKLMLLRSAAAYANSRLHAVKAEVLVLAR